MVKSAYQPQGHHPIARTKSRFTVRLWSIKHSRGFEILYNQLAKVFLKLHPIWNWLGYQRIERPVVAVERTVKAFLFDCRMCGQCILSDTGMSCPMNCPKSIRNGPCGGVRADGNCEVEPDMPCVWVEAWRGSQQMSEDKNILKIQGPVDHSLRGTSAWLRATSQSADAVAIKRET